MNYTIILRADGTIVFVFLGIIALIVFLVWYFSKRAIIRRALKNTPHKPIAQFQEGEKGKVIGKIVYAGQTLQAPLTGRICAAYQVEVQEWRRSGKHSSWVTIINEEKTGDIVLSDGTNHAWVEPNGLHFYLIQDGNFSSGTGNDAAPHLEAFLSSRGTKSTGLFGWNKKLRYREGTLEENEMLAVVGHGKWGSARQRNLNLSADRILTMNPDDKGKVYLTDDPEMLKQQ